MPTNDAEPPWVEPLRRAERLLHQALLDPDCPPAARQQIEQLKRDLESQLAAADDADQREPGDLLPFPNVPTT